MITLVDLKDMTPHRAVDLTWQLLDERPEEASISHREMPTWTQHQHYVMNHNYRAWYAVVNDSGTAVGTVLLTQHNEIGVAILAMHQRRGYARQAITELMRKHPPHPAVPGQRVGRFLANVNPNNAASIALFTGMGARLIQNTYEL